MRDLPPPMFVRRRHFLLAGALTALAVAAAVLLLFKGTASFPSQIVVPVAAITFVWANGAFWWLELRYPHIEQASGRYVSRVESSSKFVRGYSNFFFGAYSVGAILVTLACIRAAVGG